MELTTKGLTHVYHPHSPLERVALDGINLTIPSGSFVSIIGHTGSGKSTLIQHFNGLLKPTEGSLQIGETRIEARSKEKALRAVRQKIGMVFQYPEHQLFEETVEKDLCFGPLNFGLDLETAKIRARTALQQVGLSEALLSRSPFELSGGQMRRVAIAGVLASDPEVLILDEPTAGLDPRGREEMMALFSKLNREKGLTIIMVTHSMDDAAVYSDKVIVMDQGIVRMEGPPKEVFSKPEQLRSLGLDVPTTMDFLERLNKKWEEGQLLVPLFSIGKTSQHVANLLKANKEGR
jgi:energy-coupling factor transport system ATP-binding protein